MTHNQAGSVRRSRFSLFCSRNRFLILFCFLLILLVVSPVANSLEHRFASLLISVLFSFLLISGVYATGGSRRFLNISLVLAIPTFFLLYVNTFANHVHMLALTHALSILFIGFECFAIFVVLFRQRSVTRDTIFAALCVYLLIGVLFAILYSLLSLYGFATFSYSFDITNEAEYIRFGGDSTLYTLYFSFVTMTTLGFGDIVPTSNLARMIVSVQAIIGQLYLAVLVARLVGMHSTRSPVSENQKECES